MNKRPANPLFAPGGGGGGFSLAESFGVTASLPVTSAEAEEDSFVGGGGGGGGPALYSSTLTPAGPPTSSMIPSPISFFRSSPAVGEDMFSQVTSSANSPQSVPLSFPYPPIMSTPLTLR